MNDDPPGGRHWPEFAARVQRLHARGVGWQDAAWPPPGPTTLRSPSAARAEGNDQPRDADALASGGPRHDDSPAGDAPRDADAATLRAERDRDAAALARRLPADFIATARWALLHSDADRHRRLHRMIERLLEDRRHWLDTLHPEHVHLQALARQVRRDLHKMKAFVRFTRVPDGARERYVAWFEPEHDIVDAAAPFFARRFASMDWAILTPQGSVQWSDGRLQRGPPATRADASPPDAGEALWLTYYERIFNPARVKVAAMRREMPVRYWKNLPEATRIAPLLSQAAQRVARMVPAQRPLAIGPGDSAASDPVGRDGSNGNPIRDDANRRRGCARASPGAIAADPSAGNPLDGGPGSGSIASDATSTLNRLRARASACDDCPCAAVATQTVWGEGPAGARIAIVGEQPGDREDLEGRPFVGPAGTLLDAALAQLGWPRERLYLTNAVKHFQYTWRGKRRMHKTPAQREVEACERWLEAELGAVAPQLVIALGRTAERATMAWSDRWPVAVLPHPSALLRQGIDASHPRFAQWVELFQQAASRLSPPGP